ncbi:ATP-binding cassette sub-family G member 2 [Willisornis vidua]|uniref:ABC-type xenobiotic transporter n=1 Tax=Willisornis vidua TaxID=1566151 RepID=A0ABQ9D3U9_9PASS|nr:ATP-binding cassette sub-family G member 2 [Willisornis vidua]
MAEDQPHLCIQMSDPNTNGIPSRRPSSLDLAGRGGSVLTFYNISYRVNTKTGFLCCQKTATKEVLRDVKLLDILAARKDPHGLSGDILINGAPQPANFKCTSGYVVQDDVVMGTLTVRENLTFSAALRLPKSVKEQEKKERVNQIIKELGLSKVADSKVGTQFTRGVSGGERKRTNIGMELITDPAILFLDEPTTGLDASTANAVLLLLKRMAKQGKTVIFSIHQPRYSIFRLFDNLTLLAAGRVLYHGPAQHAIRYFESIGYQCEPYNNPADFFLDVINGDSTAVAMSKSDEANTAENTEERTECDTTLAEQLAEKYSDSTYYQETKAQLENISLGNKKKTKSVFRQITYANSFLHQLKWVSRRAFKNLIGNPQASIAQVCVTAFLGLVVGAIFFGLKEDSTGLQNRLVSLGLKPTVEAFFTMMFTLMMVSYTATSMALAIAAGQSVVAVANLLMTVTFVFMILFSGLLVNLTSVLPWLSWLKYLSIPRYGMTALQINELKGMNFCGTINNTVLSRFIYEQMDQMECTGDGYLKSQGIDASTWGLWQNHVALACMSLIFLTIAYLKLHFMKKFS